MNYYIFNSSWYVAGVLCGSHLVPMMIIVIIYVNTNPLYGWGHWGLEELRVVPKVHSQEVAELRLKPTFLSQHLTCFPDSSAGKESACNARDLGSIPGSARSPQEGNGSPLQYSCLENSMDRGAWQVQSIGSQRVGHDCETHTHALSCLLRIPCVLSLQIGQFGGVSKTLKSSVELNMTPGVWKVVILVIVRI